MYVHALQPTSPTWDHVRFWWKREISTKILQKWYISTLWNITHLFIINLIYLEYCVCLISGIFDSKVVHHFPPNFSIFRSSFSFPNVIAFSPFLDVIPQIFLCLPLVLLPSTIPSSTTCIYPPLDPLIICPANPIFLLDHLIFSALPISFTFLFVTWSVYLTFRILL